MPYLSDMGRETADKAERLFTVINSRFSARGGATLATNVDQAA